MYGENLRFISAGRSGPARLFSRGVLFRSIHSRRDAFPAIPIPAQNRAPRSVPDLMDMPETEDPEDITDFPVLYIKKEQAELNLMCGIIQFCLFFC